MYYFQTSQQFCKIRWCYQFTGEETESQKIHHQGNDRAGCSRSAQLQRPCGLCYTKCFLTDRIVYFSLAQNGSLLLLKEKALTFFNLGSLGRFETQIKPTFAKLRSSKVTNSASKSSIFPSFDLQLPRTSSQIAARVWFLSSRQILLFIAMFLSSPTLQT